MSKNKISNFTQLSELIKNNVWRTISPREQEFSFRTEEHLHSLADSHEEVRRYLNDEEDTGLVLLSKVVRSKTELFSTKEARVLPDKKTVDKKGSVIDLYKAMRTYSAAFGVLFQFQEKRSTGLCTDFLVKDLDALKSFLTENFPIAALVHINDQKIGLIREMVVELEEEEELGVDYLFSTLTGEYICPVHQVISKIQKRLLPFKSRNSESLDPLGVLNSNTLTEGYRDSNKNSLPLSVFLGVEFDSPVFTFGRAINAKIFENIFSATNDYGKNGSDAIKSAYKNLQIKRRSILHKPSLNEGVAYQTTNLNSEKVKLESTFNPPRKFIPSLEHFQETGVAPSINKTLKELKAEDVIKIFPETELLILKLTIGRAIIGVSDSRGYMDENFIVSHDWRKCVVVNGRAKIGKSTVLSKISQAMEWCGFDVVAGVNLAERFNVKKAVLSDLSIFDDLTEERLIANLGADNFKTTITGGQMSVEEKGIDKEEVTPRTTIIGNINDLRTEALYEIDSGSKDRFVAISAFKAKPGEDPYSLTKKIAKELGVNEIAIWVRVLRDCLDTALGFCEINGEKAREGISINEKINQISLSNHTYFDSQPGVTFLILCLVVASYELGDCERV